jgi:hypothetical protein
VWAVEQASCLSLKLRHDRYERCASSLSEETPGGGAQKNSSLNGFPNGLLNAEPLSFYLTSYEKPFLDEID